MPLRLVGHVLRETAETVDGDLCCTTILTSVTGFMFPFTTLLPLTSSASSLCLVLGVAVSRCIIISSRPLAWIYVVSAVLRSI